MVDFDVEPHHAQRGRSEGKGVSTRRLFAAVRDLDPRAGCRACLRPCSTGLPRRVRRLKRPHHTPR